MAWVRLDDVKSHFGVRQFPGLTVAIAIYISFSYLLFFNSLADFHQRLIRQVTVFSVRMGTFNLWIRESLVFGWPNLGLQWLLRGIVISHLNEGLSV